jgi:hypothetical protein
MSTEIQASTPELPSTVRQLFKNGVIRESQEANENIKFNDELLDKVAFWCVISNSPDGITADDMMISDCSRGDITVLDVDAIVNAANQSLLGLLMS